MSDALPQHTVDWSDGHDHEPAEGWWVTIYKDPPEKWGPYEGDDRDAVRSAYRDAGLPSPFPANDGTKIRAALGCAAVAAGQCDLDLDAEQVGVGGLELDDLRTALIDTVANILFYAEVLSIDPEKVLDRGRTHFERRRDGS